MMLRHILIPILIANLAGLEASARTSARKPTTARSRAVASKPSPARYSPQKWSFVSYDGGAETPNKQSTLVFQRYVGLGTITYPVATLTHSVVPRGKTLSASQSRTEATQLAKNLQKALKSPAWKSGCQGQRCEFSLDWPEKNRYIQLVYKNLGDKYALSLSTTRRAYSWPVADEAKILQISFAETEKSSGVAFEWNSLRDKFFALFAIDRAWAQAADFIEFPAIPGINGGQPYRVPRAQFDLVRSQYQQFLDVTRQQGSRFVDDATRSAADAVNNVTNNAVARGQEFVDTTAGRVDQSVTSAVTQAEASAMRVEQQANRDANQLLDRAMKATKLKNVAAMAFVGAAAGTAGAVVANAVINFLADGTAELVSSLYHSIMGTLNSDQKEQMKSLAGQAFVELERAAADITRLEIELDKRITALSMAQEMPVGDLAQSIGVQMNLKERELNQLTRQLYASTSDADAKECALRLTNAQNEVELYKYIRQTLVGDERNSHGVCAKLDALFREWPQMEARLQLAREQISNAAPAIIQQLTKNMLTAHTEVSSARRRGNFCKQDIDDLEKLARSIKGSPNCSAQIYSQYRYSTQNPQRDSRFESWVDEQCAGQARTRVNQDIEAMKASCDTIISQNENRDHSAALMNSMQATRGSIEAITGTLTEIMKKDCEEGVVAGNCDGRAGAFSQLRQRYERLHQLAAQKCGKPMYRPPAYTHTGVGGLANIAPGTQPAASSEGPGWVGRQFNAIGSFFSSLWPF